MRLIGLAVVFALGLALAPVFGQTQQPRTIRIGWLANGSSATAGYFLDSFRQGLRELGHVEDSSIIIESRFADGRMERLPGLAVELVRMPVDIVVAAGPEGAKGGF